MAVYLCETGLVYSLDREYIAAGFQASGSGCLVIIPFPCPGDRERCSCHDWHSDITN